jgi:hypothetical protein
MAVDKNKVRWTIVIILSVIAYIALIGTTGCATTESTYIVEPNDTTNYNATYILP